MKNGKGTIFKLGVPELESENVKSQALTPTTRNRNPRSFAGILATLICLSVVASTSPASASIGSVADTQVYGFMLGGGGALPANGAPLLSTFPTFDDETLGGGTFLDAGGGAVSGANLPTMAALLNGVDTDAISLVNPQAPAGNVGIVNKNGLNLSMPGNFLAAPFSGNFGGPNLTGPIQPINLAAADGSKATTSLTASYTPLAQYNSTFVALTALPTYTSPNANGVSGVYGFVFQVDYNVLAGGLTATPSLLSITANATSAAGGRAIEESGFAEYFTPQGGGAQVLLGGLTGFDNQLVPANGNKTLSIQQQGKIGRASCRERV
jgi:hypothetical protein